MKYNRIRRIVRARNGSQIPKFLNAGILDMVLNPYMAPNSIAILRPSAIDVANATLLPLDFSKPPSKFQQTMLKFGQKAGLFIGLNQNMISLGADMFGNFMNFKVKNSENAEKGFMAANMATDILGKVNPTLGIYSKIGLAGFKTFNSTFDKKTQDFSADTNMLALIGNSYGDSSKDILDASSNAGKKYGLFSNRARRKANRAINDARELQNTMIDIANEAMDLRNAIRDINYLTYQNDINGGWGYNYMRVAKSGMKLSDKIDLVKKRRTANNFINVDTKEIELEPIIVNIEEFKEGGDIDTAATMSDWWKGTWSYLSGNKDSGLLESLYKPSKSTDSNAKYYYREGLNNDVIKNILGGSEYGKKDVFGQDLFYKDFNDVWDRLSAKGGRAERNTDNSHLGAYTIGIGEDSKGRYISYYDKFDWAPDGVKELFHPYEIYNRIYEDEFNRIQEALNGVNYKGSNPSGNWFFKPGQKLYNHIKNHKEGGSIKESDIQKIEETTQKNIIPELWEPIIDDIADYWEPVIDDVEYYQEGGKLENDLNIVFEISSKLKTRTIEQLIEEAKKQNPRFILRMSEPLRYIRINSKDASGKEFWSHATHEMTYQNNEVYPMILEIKGKLRLFNDPLEAYKNAKANNNVLKFNSEEEAKLFAKSGIDDNGEYYGYKLGWADFFNTSPVGIKEEYSIDRFRDGGKTKEELETPEIEETTQKNIIPEGALHKNKHHMEHSEGLTLKGIPVVDNNGEQLAEIELNEIIFTLEVTKKLEELYKEGTDEAAIEAGKLLVKEILFNTDDRTSLINKILI